jgi:GH24 family phage-related lysozyme (muramidase)
MEREMINRAGLDLIRKWEGCRLTAYRDVGGIYTIGFGHTAAAGEPVPVKGMRITAEEAERILARDLGQYERAVVEAVTRPMNENQFAACVSLCLNIGTGAFARSTLVKRWNAGDFAGAADAFLAWVTVKGKRVEGLANRRKAERALFLAPTARMAVPWAEKAVQPPLPDEGRDMAPLPAPSPTGFPGGFVGMILAALAAALAALWQWWEEMLIFLGLT